MVRTVSSLMAQWIKNPVLSLSGLSGYCDAGSGPGPGTATCLRCGQKKKKKKMGAFYPTELPCNAHGSSPNLALSWCHRARFWLTQPAGDLMDDLVMEGGEVGNHREQKVIGSMGFASWKSSGSTGASKAQETGRCVTIL